MFLSLCGNYSLTLVPARKLITNVIIMYHTHRQTKKWKISALYNKHRSKTDELSSFFPSVKSQRSDFE